jgi:hypothetical protein
MFDATSAILKSIGGIDGRGTGGLLGAAGSLAKWGLGKIGVLDEPLVTIDGDISEIDSMLFPEAAGAAAGVVNDVATDAAAEVGSDALIDAFGNFLV